MVSAQPLLWSDLAARTVISLWLVVAAWWDARTARISNLLSLPVMLAVGLARMISGPAEVRVWVLVAWVLLFGLWNLHFIGGGDAKMLMSAFALFPTVFFALLFGVVALLIKMPLLVAEHVRGSVTESLRTLSLRMLFGLVLPTEEELRLRGKQYLWTFAVPTFLYTWVYWGVVPA
jgi:Flp pilus assembly protein protease CpaA